MPTGAIELSGRIPDGAVTFEMFSFNVPYTPIKILHRCLSYNNISSRNKKNELLLLKYRL